MPIEMNRINRECPECKNSVIFELSNKSYFCGRCLTEFDSEMKIKTKMSIDAEVAKIVRDSPDTVQEIEVIAHVTSSIQEQLEPVSTSQDNTTEELLETNNTNEIQDNMEDLSEHMSTE